MKIKLTGALPRQLKEMGLKPGEKFEAMPAENTRLGAMRFKVMVGDEEQVATVYKENYIEL